MRELTSQHLGRVCGGGIGADAGALRTMQSSRESLWQNAAITETGAEALPSPRVAAHSSGGLAAPAMHPADGRTNVAMSNLFGHLTR